MNDMNDNYTKVAKAIAYIQENYESQPSLEQIAKQAGLSAYHFQRIFTQYVGVSPKRLLENFTVNKAKQMLRASASITDTADALGLSSTSRLYDHFIHLEAMTPGEYKRYGEDIEINYGVHIGLLGPMLIAETARGICWLAFLPGSDAAEGIAEMRAHWPLSQFQETQAVTLKSAKKIFSNHAEEFTLLVKGTNFQINVWRALLKIPNGHVVSYKTIAKFVARPAASRAAANAIGSNSIACLIPCHRVLRESGEPGGYRWGVSKKRTLLALEAAREG